MTPNSCWPVLLLLGCSVLQTPAAQSADERPLSADQDRLDPDATHENMQEELRSIELERIQDILPSVTRKIDVPTIQKLYHSVTNLPLRFGRASQPVANLPLRFGRGLTEGSARKAKAALNLPQRFGRAPARLPPLPAVPQRAVYAPVEEDEKSSQEL
nr:PREDICTED: pro-FMRFamide-related neuropeptide VF [Lepisosteus oculatus]